MNKVVIVVKFITGTTQADPSEAKKTCLEMFWREIERIGIKEDERTGQALFSVVVQDISAK